MTNPWERALASRTDTEASAGSSPSTGGRCTLRQPASSTCASRAQPSSCTGRKCSTAWLLRAAPGRPEGRRRARESPAVVPGDRRGAAEERGAPLDGRRASWRVHAGAAGGRSQQACMQHAGAHALHHGQLCQDGRVRRPVPCALAVCLDGAVLQRRRARRTCPGCRR